MLSLLLTLNSYIKWCESQKSIFVSNWHSLYTFEPCQLNKTMKIRVMGLGLREISPYHRANPLHNSLPSINLLSFWKFKAATLKPKNSFVLSFRRTGILTTWNLFRRRDGTVSTPFRIRPTRERLASVSGDLSAMTFALDFTEKTLTAVRFFIAGWHCSR